MCGIVVLRDCGIAENTGMSDGAHLLIPLASCGAPGCQEARSQLALPRLEKLLARLTPGDTDAGDDTALSMPHERVLARESGLPHEDGRIPWAAWQVAQSGSDTQGEAWAWITPCHWRVATDHITMGPPQALELGAEESQALLAAMRPYFEEDGIALEYAAPTLWLARGAVFADFASASLDRVIGRTIDAWLPRAAHARTIRRLQQEMQMLLYTHPINEARLGRGLLPVNSFWVSGTGALPPAGVAKASAAKPPTLHMPQQLREAALLGDWPAWSSAWQQIDTRDCGALLQSLDNGGDVALTLCGERNARTWRSQGAGWLRKLTAALPSPGGLRARRIAAVLDTL